MATSGKIELRGAMQVLPWSEFRKKIDGTESALAFIFDDDDLSYRVVSSEAHPGVQYVCWLTKGSADAQDWEDSFQDTVFHSAQTTDGKQIVQPNLFPPEVQVVFAGAGDAPGARLGGPLFQVSKAGQGDVQQEFSFIDGVYLTGGHVYWRDGAPGAWVAMQLRAPASVVQDAGGAGNCNLVPTGLGFNIIVPAAGNGAKNLVTPVPVPANHDETNAANGYWDYADLWVGKGAVTASATPGQAKWNLYDADLLLSQPVKIPLLNAEGQHALKLDALNPKWVLPHWYFRVIAHNEDATKTLLVSWETTIARRKTV